MKIFKSIKVGVKLVAAFMVVAIIAGIVGLVAILNLDKLGKNDVLLYEENTLGLAYSGEASVSFQRARFNAMKMTVTDGTEREACIANIDKYVAITDTNMADYEAGLISEEDRAIFTETNTLWLEYKEHLSKAIGLAEDNRPDEALQYILNNTAQTATSLQESYQKLYEYNKQTAKARSIDNISTAQSSKLVMIAIVSLGVVIAVSLGLGMTRSITLPVNTTANLLNLMAKGEDLEAIDAEKYGGEFRQMAQSLNSVISSLYLLLGDSGMLVKAAAEGKLSTRADATRHLGGYRQIIEGFNSTLDAVITPINEAAEVLKELSNGNLNISITSNFAGDYSIIKKAINETVDALKGYILEISSVLSEVSKGNLAVSIDSEYKGDFISLKDALNTIVESLNGVMSEINIAADQVASGTQQVSDGSQEISQGATEQAASLEELTASITQIAAQTRQNATNATMANELSITARNDATTGNEHMKDMQKAMVDINESSASISKIIKVIDDIAFQTNILALNAAVEAARAGAHGKGFAVVAEEVRNLAARSANAAKETTDLIEGSIRRVEVGTKYADSTALALAGIVNGIEKTVQLVGQIAGASNEQASGVAQINAGIEQLSLVVQTNSATSEEAAAASEELSGQAAMLKAMVARFKLKDDSNSFHTSNMTKGETPPKELRTKNQKAIIPNNAEAEFDKY